MLLMFLVVAVNIAFFTRGAIGKADNEDTVQFINEWMRNDNGTFATYLKETIEKDEDKVQGREALSESLGLWMLYAIENDDEAMFEERFRLLKTYFMTGEGFISWKLPETGESDVQTNALIDDLRIYKALILAYRQWGATEYLTAADKVGTFLGSNLIYQSVLVDFYDRFYDYQTQTITLSYLDPEAIKMLEQHGHITPSSYKKMTALLQEVPLKNGFYPKSYNVQTKKMVFDEEINLIDQLLVAINRSQLDFNSDELLIFIKKELEQRGVLNGRYSITTRSPMVAYESPAIYGFVILYAIEIKDRELALQAYQRMIDFRVNRSKFRGAYSINEDQNTHIFDNLVPLLAIQKLKNAQWIS